MTSIILTHAHYDPDHLEAVKGEMTRRGAPVIRAIWSEVYASYLAVEGCHRIRAAKELGLTPVVKDITHNKTVRLQSDDEIVTVKVADLAAELEGSAYQSEIFHF